MRSSRIVSCIALAAFACTSPPSKPLAVTPPLPSAIANVAAPIDASQEVSPSTINSAAFAIDAGAADDEATRAEIATRFQGDRRALATALGMFAREGDIIETLPEENWSGGFRGQIHLVPQLPIGAYENHLEWISSARIDHQKFFESIAKLAAAAGHELKYRWKAIRFRFTRSVGGHRPSAYAVDWSIAYNVEGSLNLNADAVRETLFHEMFHLNDQAHGDFTPGAFGSFFDAIVKRCGTRIECLAPFAPNDTRVRGGTYYAFQPNNGQAVHEYGAELAVRYYKEQRAILAGRAPPLHPFKCGPDPNPVTWKKMVDEFFGGVDLVPPCK
jgi:hypothetical protein